MLEGELSPATYGASGEHCACGGVEGEGSRCVLSLGGYVCEYCEQGREDEDCHSEVAERRGEEGE